MFQGKKSINQSEGERGMNSVIYLIGLAVVIYFVLKFFGLI